MTRIPFDEKEMEILAAVPNRGNNPPSHKLNYPVSPKENLLAMYRGETPLWIPLYNDTKAFGPDCMPENRVRGFVIEAQKVAKEDFGGKDMFGVPWIYEDQVGGSMVVPGSAKVEFMDEWKGALEFPDPESWDWEACSERNKEFLEKNYKDKLIRVTIFTGFFERLISWMDFENAAMAMYDEDSEEDVHEALEYCADLYIKEIELIKKYFPQTDVIMIHDDWGSQKAPFFSPNVVRKIIAPHFKKVVDKIHELGMVFDLHSCGMNAELTPVMAEIGMDSWSPQMINDTLDITQKYGENIIITLIPENTPKGLSPEEYDELAKKWVDEHIELFKAHPFIFQSTPMDPFGKAYIDPLFVDGVYKYSRIALMDCE